MADEFVYPDFVEKWSKLQKALENANKVRDKLDLLYDELYRKEAVFIEKAGKAGYKLDRQTQTWIKKEEEEEEDNG